jgi:hypothetical protein
MKAHLQEIWGRNELVVVPCFAMVGTLRLTSPEQSHPHAPRKTENPSTTSRRKRFQRVATVSHIVIGTTVACESVELLSHEQGILAWLSLIAGAALAFAGIWELLATQRHHLMMFVLQLVTGGEICLSAAEGFRQHKHYIQWVLLAAGLAAIFFGIVKYVISRRFECD